MGMEMEMEMAMEMHHFILECERNETELPMEMKNLFGM